MPTNPVIKGTIPEWRTMVAAARHYRECLAATAGSMVDEDEQLLAYDDLERLDRMIPRLERQLTEYLQETTELVA